MHPARLVHHLRTLRGSDPLAPVLLAFTPNPNSTATVYTFRCFGTHAIAYARRPDSIIPYDKLSVMVYRDAVVEAHMPTRSPADIYAFFCSKITSFSWSCIVLSYLFGLKDPCLHFVDALFERACDIGAAMPLEKKIYYRRWARHQPWPQAYRAALECFLV